MQRRKGTPQQCPDRKPSSDAAQAVPGNAWADKPPTPVTLSYLPLSDCPFMLATSFLEEDWNQCILVH